MTRTQNWRPTPSMDPVYNRTIQYDERANGIKMPLVNPDMTPIRQRQFDSEKHKITAHLHATRGAA